MDIIERLRADGRAGGVMDIIERLRGYCVCDDWRPEQCAECAGAETITTLLATVEAKNKEIARMDRVLLNEVANRGEAEARVKELENISERPHSYRVLCEEIKILRRGEIELKAQLVEAEREWSNLALAIAQSLDPECSDADWSDILGTFDPWDCLRQAHTELAEAKQDAAGLVADMQCLECRHDSMEQQWVCEHCGHRAAIDDAKGE